jgi:hypothetical protein
LHKFDVLVTVFPSDVTLMRHVEAARWITDRMPHGDIRELATFVPGGFDAYLRVFHPGAFRPTHSGAIDPAVAVRWADLAAAKGVQVSAEIAFREILTPAELSDSRLAHLEPLSGTLPPEQCSVLASLLGAHTVTPATCWFCLWEGNSSLWSNSCSPERAVPQENGHGKFNEVTIAPDRQDSWLSAYPTVDAPWRRYFLCRGPLAAACSFYDMIGATPSIWWPEDHAWIVVTEVDSYSTYVGGSRAAADSILACGDLEAIEVDLGVLIDPGDGRGPIG